MLFLFGVLLEFAVVNRYERLALEARLRKNHVRLVGRRCQKFFLPLRCFL